MDISTLSFAELKALSINVAFAIKASEAAAIANARQQIAEIAKAAGISLDDLLRGAKPAGAPRVSVPAPIKFRNPDDSTQAWSGRGRSPKWFLDCLEAGKTNADLAA